MTAKSRTRGMPRLTLLLLLVGAPVTIAAEPEPRTIELWPEGAPGATGNSDEDKPAITVYLPDPAEHRHRGVDLSWRWLHDASGQP